MKQNENKVWRSCVAYYIEQQWCGVDRRFVRQFSGTPTCEMLADLFSPVNYQVARTIPGTGIAKYRRFAALLNEHKATELSLEVVPQIVETILSGLAFSRRPISAVSKALWMMRQHPVAIYDSFAWGGLHRLGLKPGYGGYGSFYEAWMRFFGAQQTKDGLAEAIAWFMPSEIAKRLIDEGKITATEVESLATSDLLKNRAVDRRLMLEGLFTAD